MRKIFPSRALLTIFLAGIPGLPLHAQTIGRVGTVVPVAGAGAIGASLNGASAMPALSATLSPASLALTPLAVAPALKPAALAAQVQPAPAKALLEGAALQAKALIAPETSGGAAKSAAAKPFDGSDGKGPNDSVVPAALTPRLSAPASDAPGSPDDKPTAQELAKIRAAIRKVHQPGDVLNLPTIKLVAKEAAMSPLRTLATLQDLAARGELMQLSDHMYVHTNAHGRAGTGTGDARLAHDQVMAGIRQLNEQGSIHKTVAVALLGDALELYRKIEAPELVQEETAVLFNNALLEMTRNVLGDYDRGLIKGGVGAEDERRAHIAAAQQALKGRAFAIDSPAPELLSGELAAWVGGIFDKISYRAEMKEQVGANAVDAGIERYKAFHKASSGASGSKKAAPDTIEGLKSKMAAIGMPAHIQEIATREFEKLKQLNPQDGEAQKLRTYLDWLLGMPWGQRTEDNLNIPQAREILDRDHFGLEKVKERVLEFLALRKKTGSKKGAIIAFTGPPGVGKTSIASAIAQALGRKFVRLSLGGVHDESVLRGHGRTYTGSMPGEIMRQMKVAGTVNPVMLMDEADKIGRNGNHGDPTAALLEILDPAQNNTYRDRYLDVPYDLSEVLFVVTSNELSNIPEPLRDRMEIIEFDGYTTLEKIQIAERHVIPQKLAATGLKPEEAQLTKDAIRRVIEGYTMEAGVRSLREKIEAILRKISAWTETRGEKVPGAVDESMVEKYLGVERFSPRQTAQNGVGVATGLAVNTYGGSTLNVEVSKEPGTGQLKLRKQFGDDIEDSAKNALKYVKQNAAKFGLQGFDFTKYDIDINITPAGKVDGPSAGGLMVTAIISALTGRPVTPGVAMTGEITMRGDILPIGGLKQKVMAAHRMGYKEVIFPYANLKDLEDIPKEVRDGIKLTAARTYDDIYPSAIVKAAP